MKKILAITVTGLLILTVAAGAQPGNGGMCNFDKGSMGKMHQGGGRQSGHPGIGGFMRFAEELQLTDDQIQTLETMRTEFQLGQVDAKAELKKAEILLRKLMKDDDASQSNVLAAIDEVSKMKAEIQKKRYLHMTEAKELLTGDQLEKAKELRRECRQDRFGRNSDGDSQGSHKRGRRHGRG